MVEDCETREERLSDFERTFIDSIGKQLRDGKGLSQKQIDLLDEVWNRVTEQG